MCRAIVRDEHGQPLIYNSVPGQLSVKFNEEIPHPIEVLKTLFYFVVEVESYFVYSY